MRLGVASAGGAWVVAMVVLLLGAGMMQPPTTEAAAAPHGCCRRGRFAAAALGFIGGYLAGRHHGYHHGGCGGCGSGCGGCGGGCGWCGGGYYGRRRRSLDEVMEREVIEDMFMKFASQDKDQCGLRLVCELAQKDPNYLTGDETLILLPYRGRDESDEKSYYGRYDKAVWHGQHGNPCKELFSKCPYSAPQIMGYTATNTTDTVA